jgi:hypothetical protein
MNRHERRKATAELSKGARIIDTNELTDTHSLPLDTLVRAISKEVERYFKVTGSLSMIWFVETPKGIIRVASPVPAVDDPADGFKVKDGIAQVMRSFLREHDATRYAFAAESWTVRCDPDPYASHATLEDHPQRGEVVWRYAEDGRETVYAVSDIVRPTDRNPYLTEFTVDHHDTSAKGGRFSDLLPDRTIH